MTALIDGTAAADTRPESRPHVRRARRDSVLTVIAERSILIVLAIMFLAPLAFVLLTSFMTTDQAAGPKLWPSPLHPQNFVDVFSKSGLVRATINTVIYAGLSTLGVVISSVPVAYALSRLQWRGRGTAFILVLATMMLPAQITAVPLYIMFAKLHLVGTLAPLIIPSFFGDAFSIFLLRQFLLTIPQEYVDAARVDGAGEWRILLKIVVPLAKPAIAAIALFSFLYAWNDFFGPLLYAGENSNAWTVSVALSNLRGQHHVQWNLTMAATVLFMLPVIVLFFAAQKAFVQGVTLTGVK
ncbi:MAG: carbohydrate ABC transporter permease [Actinomycetota bacterium]|nr:carbohydrate ABC transporter permease [Actinomycetota bacterium]